MSNPREAEVLDSLRGIIDPDLGKDIVTLGFIKELQIDQQGRVSFNVELTTPACPVKEQFRTQCEEAVSALPWVTSARVTMTAQKGRGSTPAGSGPSGLKDVATILAVSSCKGGVGKSTIAVNLAFTLAATGARVGIFDADVYGPSLPTLVRMPCDGLMQYQGMVQPLEYEGVKLMSFGHAAGPDAGPAIMRGPMVTQVIQQLLMGTEWGELDYLVLDLPPGTGDVQLTLTQSAPIAAAVIVTTPQQLSYIDVEKGIEMFTKVKVPAVAVVENLSYFQPEPGGEKYLLFGRGAREKLVEKYGFKSTFEMPIEPALSAACDAGRPYVLDAPDSELAQRFRDLAGAVVRDISTLQHGAETLPQLAHDPDDGIYYRQPDGTTYLFNPVDLRMACRGAHTVDEFTGELRLKREDIPADIHPEDIAPLGNYAVRVGWSHEHPPSIFPYDQLAELAESVGKKITVADSLG